jgi:uncharacterized protein YwgA
MSPRDGNLLKQRPSEEAGVLALSSRLEAVDKKLLFLIHTYGKALSKRKLHQLVYDLQERYRVNLGFRFAGQPPFSQDLEDRLEALVEKGFLKKVYVVGSRFTILYKPYYAITEKGVKAIEKRDFSKSDQEAIERLVQEYKAAKGAPAPSEVVRPAQE